MADLLLEVFTAKSDVVVSQDGWELASGATVDALAGNDSITGSGGSSSLGRGIFNSGMINTGTGNDTITGSGGRIGISNDGTINTGTGNDTITGSGVSFGSVGISNSGTINTGAGKDTITGRGGSSGAGISNNGLINTGKGKDTIIGSGGSGGGSGGISNFGTIKTGKGKDTVNALEGGFSGDGTTNLGKGKDTLIGFGSGIFNGGAGKDKILFGKGTYVINGGTITSIGITMNVSSFESIGGVNADAINDGTLFAFANGTLTVTDDGTATFAI